MRVRCSLVVIMVFSGLVCAFLVLFVIGGMKGGVAGLDNASIELVEGRKHEFFFSVEDACLYELGISVSAERGGSKTIEEMFGTPLRLEFPVSIDLKVVGNDGYVAFERRAYGGRGLMFRYGPDPLRFIAGNMPRHTGRYVAVVRVNKVYRELSQVRARFFVERVPKIRCKK